MKSPNKKIVRSKNTTPSITDWFSRILVPRAPAFLYEDNTKYDRLLILNKIFGLPYPIPTTLDSNDIINRTEKLKNILNNWDKQQCILRLVPLTKKLPKIRKKGGSLKNNLHWLKKQTINYNQYRIEIIPRCPKVKWASIFIVNKNGIWGEIIRGGLSQLVTGKYKKLPTYYFYDFKKWYYSKKNNRAENKIVKDAIKKIRIDNLKKQKLLKKTLHSSFTPNHYLKGYFEFVVWPKEGIKFNDYNRQQSKTFDNFDALKIIKRNINLCGISVSKDNAVGIAKIITDKNDYKKFNKGDVLVVKMLSIEHAPLMKKASAIIAEGGSMLCHAALISREMNKPCIMRVKHATKIIKNYDVISVDADKGLIQLIIK